MSLNPVILPSIVKGRSLMVVFFIWSMRTVGLMAGLELGSRRSLSCPPCPLATKPDSAGIGKVTVSTPPPPRNDWWLSEVEVRVSLPLPPTKVSAPTVPLRSSSPASP